MNFAFLAEHSDSMRNLSQSKIRSAPIPLPPLEEQVEIARTIHRDIQVAETLERSLAEKLDLLTGLDQSILAKAFRGELVPQDPNDEPASVLLERIRKEREKAEAERKPTRKGRRRKTG